MSEKSIVILTNYWDANSLIGGGVMLFEDPKDKRIYKINFLNMKSEPESKLQNKPLNYSVHSIALNAPGLTPKLNNLYGIDRLDFFCPTYDLLKKYKSDGDWNYYTERYIEIMKSRKKRITEWMNSLKPDWIYVLCCWENTEKGAHCHRELLFKAFSASKTACSKMISIYRHGGKAEKNVVQPKSNGHETLETIIELSGLTLSSSHVITNGIANGWNLPVLPES